MPRRTTPSDAEEVIVADDLQLLVRDKREGWRGSDAKARRRTRRYSKLLTEHLRKLDAEMLGPDELSDEV